MIKIGVAGIPLECKGKGTEQGIKHLGDIGLDAMEVQFVRQVYMKPEGAQRVGEVARKSGVALSVHAPYYVNLAGDPETREKSEDRILESARRAHEMGAEIVVVHPGYRGRDAVEKIQGSLEKITTSLRGEDVRVPIGVETAGRAKQVGSLPEVLGLAQRVEGVVPVVDFAHLHAVRDGGLETREDFQRVFSEIRESLGGDAAGGLHVHFSDVEYEDGNEKRHLPLGEGDLKFEVLARILVENKFNGVVICESPLLEKDAIKMKEIIGNV